jgi:nucleoside-diphosphate-sugar epimerase
MKKNILITGGSGLVGRILVKKLKDKFNIMVLDQKKSSYSETFIGDINNLESINPAFKDIETVIHLAGDRRVHGDWKSVLENNLIGIYNIYEAAKLNKLKRVIFASSQHATGGYYNIEPYSFIDRGNYDLLPNNYSPLDEKTRIRPDSYYGTSKAFGEAIGSYYSDYCNISTINLRIGWVISDDDPTFSPTSLNLWLSHRDLTQIVEKSINASEKIKYETFYATSDNYWKIWSIDKAKKILNYQPQDSAPKNFVKREIRDADK